MPRKTKFSSTWACLQAPLSQVQKAEPILEGYLPVGMETDPNSIIDTQLQLSSLSAHSSSKSTLTNLQVQPADSVSSTQPPPEESGSSRKNRPGRAAPRQRDHQPADARSVESYSTFSSSSDSEQELAVHRAAHNARRKQTTELKGYARRVVVRSDPALPRISGSSPGSTLSQPQLQQAAADGGRSWRLGPMPGQDSGRRLSTAEDSLNSNEQGVSVEGLAGGESESAGAQTGGVQHAMSELEVMLAEAVQIGSQRARKQQQDKAQPIAGSPETGPSAILPLAFSGFASRTGKHRSSATGSAGRVEHNLEDNRSAAAAHRRARLLSEADRIMKQGMDFSSSRISIKFTRRHLLHVVICHILSVISDEEVHYAIESKPGC